MRIDKTGYDVIRYFDITRPSEVTYIKIFKINIEIVTQTYIYTTSDSRYCS